jgi:hypothetical protein
LGWYGLLLLFILPPITKGEESSHKKEEKEIGSPSPVASNERPKEYFPAGEWFFLDQAKTICGPISAQMLKDAWKEGRLFSESWVWNESIGDWKKIAQLQSLLEWLQV